jgi:hypothetical protein
VNYWPEIIGFFFGFGFGVGCALAVMYSIYMGGYRAAVRDSQLPDLPERYSRALAKFQREQKKMTSKAEGSSRNQSG